MMPKNKTQIKELLQRGVEHIFDREHLEKRLLSGKKLRIKYGIDPTGPSIHLGRAASLWKLRDFQDTGHKAVIILGDFTVRIGDASDKQAMRRIPTRQESEEYAKKYQNQLAKILDLHRAEIRYNSEWLSCLRADELLGLAEHFTAQQMVQRRNFKERWEAGRPIGLQETFYPLLQGLDSKAVKADLEIGGSDQLFNLQIGREVQRLYRQEPQDIMTLRMLVGTDGRKMSTSWGNFITVLDSPKDQLGKIMALKDELLGEYLELCSRLPASEIMRLRNLLAAKRVNPIEVKLLLGQKIVELYHGTKAAAAAAKEFERVFRQKRMPSDMRKFKARQKRMNLTDLLVETKCAISKSEARRVIQQKGVKIDGVVHDDWKEEVALKSGAVLKVGKKKFVKIAI